MPKASAHRPITSHARCWPIRIIHLPWPTSATVHMHTAHVSHATRELSMSPPPTSPPLVSHITYPPTSVRSVSHQTCLWPNSVATSTQRVCMGVMFSLANINLGSSRQAYPCSCGAPGVQALSLPSVFGVTPVECGRNLWRRSEGMKDPTWEGPELQALRVLQNEVHGWRSSAEHEEGVGSEGRGCRSVAVRGG